MRIQPETSMKNSEKQYQDKGWAWVVMCGAFLAHFLTAGCEKAFSLWYIEILDVFATNSATAAALGGMCAAVRLILAPIAVMLCDKYSIQSVVISGGLLSCAGLIISALTASISGLFIGFGLVYGFGLTLVFTPTLVVCTVYFEKRRATALSLSLSGAGFGAFCIPQLIAKLLHLFGYRGAMLIMAGVVLHYCICGAIFFTPFSSKKGDQGAENSSAKHSSFVARIRAKFVFFEFFRDVLFMLFITSFIFNMMGSGPVTTLIIHYAEELGMELRVSVFLFAIEGGVQIVARSLSGLLFDQKTLKKVRGIIWCADILSCGIVVCLFAAITNFTGMAVLMGFRGLFLAIYISHQTLMTCDMCDKPKESGLLPHAIGMTQLSKGIGILLGSLISGILKDVTGDYRVALLFLGFSQMFGAMMAFQTIIYRKHKSFCTTRDKKGLGERRRKDRDRQWECGGNGGGEQGGGGLGNGFYPSEPIAVYMISNEREGDLYGNFWRIASFLEPSLQVKITTSSLLFLSPVNMHFTITAYHSRAFDSAV
ncbi:Monocarboxylate transporter 12 [Echinococcus granulosus]|nr:Monocarboxylate transporter 12 [Echinococcus granulosus]